MLAVGRQILGNIDDQTIRMTTGFAGGVGGTHHDLCGAFSSGVMILGALYGRIDSSKDDTLCREVVKEFRHRFESQLGAVYCHELRAEDYGSQGKEPCSVLVERAAKILLTFLIQSGSWSPP